MTRPDTGRILGAVLAGGFSTRFGSDKAQALLDGKRLIDHAVEALAAQCDAVIVVGRADGDRTGIPDWPRPHMGPLGGIAGALSHAESLGYTAVLTCGIDSPRLPADLLSLLRPAPAFLRDQPVIGLWPASAAPVLKAILTDSDNHAVRHFADRIGARQVMIAAPPANINRREDLDRIEGHKL